MKRALLKQVLLQLHMRNINLLKLPLLILNLRKLNDASAQLGYCWDICIILECYCVVFPFKNAHTFSVLSSGVRSGGADRHTKDYIYAHLINPPSIRVNQMGGVYPVYRGRTSKAPTTDALPRDP